MKAINQTTKKAVCKDVASKLLSEGQVLSQKDYFTVVAIGASSGGLESFSKLLKNLSPTTGMAFIYVQHLSPDHKSLLTSILAKLTKMKVQEIDDMEKMKPNNVYIIPYNKNIEVINGHIKLVPRQNRQVSNLSIDLLFSSLAETHKENVIGIVLSGNAHDGTQGLKEIKKEGGISFAQDDSAKYKSMPQSAIAEGVVDFILSSEEIAGELNWISKHPLLNQNALKKSTEDAIENNNPDFQLILELLQKKNADFMYYKKNTIKRLILIRMLIHHIKTLEDYVTLLQKKNNELDLLYQDLLINVTEFFRDPEVFSELKKSIFPQLLKSKLPGETLRIWVAGCASGQEVYSIAITILEVQQDNDMDVPFQIFASDLSSKVIARARIGEYSNQQLKNVSDRQVKQFFIKSKDEYRISKRVRDTCVFAKHDVLLDPPFSRVDFISCRNLLTYLNVPAQKKIIGTFHYALNVSGILLLGKSENLGAPDELFSQVNMKYKIFLRKQNSGAYKIPDVSAGAVYSHPAEKNAPPGSFLKPATANIILAHELDATLLAHHMPASVVINHKLEILQFRGSTEKYLSHTSGKASFNIVKMAKPEISFELQRAIHQTIKTKQPVRKMGIRMKSGKNETSQEIVNLDVSPMKIKGEDGLLVVVFSGQHIDLVQRLSKGKKSAAAKDQRIKNLEEELAYTRSNISSIAQDQEVNEELQAANEEIVSRNEELLSLNEELEISKEEIESTNEKLNRSNYELLIRNQEVEQLSAYYEIILSTIQEPMLILDKDMCIKTANKAFYETFQVTEEECTGFSLFKLGNNQWENRRLRKLLGDRITKDVLFHNFEIKHTFPVIGPKIMLLNAHQIEKQNPKEKLIVLTILDITEVRRLSTALQVKETKDLLKAKEEAEFRTKVAQDLLTSKQQFLSYMSHEIRTPMNSIIGFTNVILKTKLTKTQKEYISAIKTSGDTLVVLVNDILDLAKVNSGKMTFACSPFRLPDSIVSITHLFEPKVKEKKLVFEKVCDKNIPEILLGDSVRLGQILLNLISNAIKFTDKGKIKLSVHLLKETTKSVSIEFKLKDSGIGIPKDRLEHIFSDFGQASPDISSNYGGTGLGLAIVKQLIKLQGGVITVHSVVGQGSVFSFILDFKKASIKDRQIAESKKQIRKEELDAPLLKDIKILIAEDFTLNQLLMKIVIEGFGFDCDIAENGKIAIEKLQQKQYDIVLMDLQMPVMNGYETTDYIRNTIHSDIPIIALTADVTTIDANKCRDLGMDDYTSKPIDEKLLYDKIVKQLHK